MLKKYFRLLLIFCVCLSCFVLNFRQNIFAQEKDETKYLFSQTEFALKIADFLLKLQNEDGAILDFPDSEIVNEDSNMEYALIGLGAAYEFSHDKRYLNGLESGIKWLAERQIVSESSPWRGSWYYAYGNKQPYNPVKYPMSEKVLDVRGVDTTCALFVYLLYLDYKLTGNSNFIEQYKNNAILALKFLIEKNRDKDGYFFSSWQNIKDDSGENWKLYKYKYSADQADVYLGFKAGSLLFSDSEYTTISDFLESNVCENMFATNLGRFYTGMDADGNFDIEPNNFAGIFSQGYLPFVFGDNIQNYQTVMWLERHSKRNGSLRCFSGDPGYALSAALYILSLHNLRMPMSYNTIQWLMKVPYDSEDGSVRDSARIGTTKYSNVAGFSIMSLLYFSFFDLHTPPNQNDVALTDGMVYAINLDKIEDCENKFIIKKPIVYSEYLNSSGKLKHDKMSVFTKISKKDYRDSFFVGISKHSSIYDNSFLKEAYKRGISCKDLNLLNSTSLKVFITYYDNNHVKHESTIKNDFTIKLPVITSISSNKGDEYSFFHPGDLLSINGRYFGDGKPSVWIENSNNGVIKRLKCKVERSFYFVSTKGKPAHSSMDRVSGFSQVKVTLPGNFPSTMFSGKYILVLKNHIGFTWKEISIDIDSEYN